MRKLLIFALVLAMPLWTRAADEQIELAVGQSELEGSGDSEEDADTAGVRYFVALADRVGVVGAIERLDGENDTGAWSLDALLRGQYNYKVLTFYVQGGIGALITDIEERTQEIAISATVEGGDGHGHHGHGSASVTASGEIETSEQEVGLRGVLGAGVQLHFSKAMRHGVGVEYGYARPLGDGFAIETERQLRAYYIVPIGE